MKNKYFKLIPAIVAVSLTFTACATASGTSQNSDSIISSQTEETESSSNTTEEDTATDTSKESQSQSETTEYFSARDLSGEIDTTNAVEITLNGDSISASSDGVSISGSNLTITKEGTYIISGTLENGSIIIDATNEEKVQLVLNGVSINSDTFAAIYVAQADKVFITLAEGTSNTLTNGGSFIQIDDNNVDAVIFSKDDITLNGIGSLKIESSAGHGIVSKDDVVIANGTYDINVSQTAIKANDNLNIADGTFNISGGSDGLHSENNDDETLGAIYIAGGTFNITASDDGIHATTILKIDGGAFDISTAEGLEATYIVINDGNISISASDDGINATQKSSIYTPTIEVNGGDITVVMGAGDTDGLDSNGDIVINGGTINVTGNSAFDYDGTGVINGGTVIVNGEEVSTLTNQMMGGRGGMGAQSGMGNKGEMGAPGEMDAQNGMSGTKGPRR